MSNESRLPQYYYSAPELPSEDENPFFDPFLDVASLDDREPSRPGDVFRSADGTSLQVQKTSYNDARDSYNPPRAGKLNWPTYNLLK